MPGRKHVLSRQGSPSPFLSEKLEPAPVPAVRVGWLILLQHKPAEFSGVEKRECSQPVSDTGSPVWTTAKSLPLGTQGVLIMLLPLLQGLAYRTTVCCVHGKHHLRSGEAWSDDQEEPQLFVCGQDCPLVASLFHMWPECREPCDIFTATTPTGECFGNN